MCLILFANDAHPHYPLVIAANRDEFLARPTEKAKLWKDHPHILAGRDLDKMGTWLGMTKEGRFAAITNYRDPSIQMNNAPSRGSLVKKFLVEKMLPNEYIDSLKKESHLFSGYNLLVGDIHSIYYFSNKSNEKYKIPRGIHGLSNHLLNTPWPKVQIGKEKLSSCLKEEKINPSCLLKILRDDWVPNDLELPNTGIGIEKERFLAPAFIRGEGYGTRSSTIILVNREYQVFFLERTYNEDNSFIDVDYHFNIR